jgi:dolichol-phosphate mannosyltransferase
VRSLAQLSIVLPAFGEAENLQHLLPRLLGLQDVAESLQIIVVDDHSADATFDVVREWAGRDPRVQGVRLARNCGSHMAILCGLSVARGNAAMVLASDGQDPPELAAQLVSRWREGAQVVWAVRQGREGETWATLAFSKAYYAFMNRWSSVRLPPSGADFFLIDRRVAEALLAIPEHNASIFALIASLGFRQAEIPYVKQSRLSGASKWTLRKKVRLALDSLVGFSTLPLKAATGLGFLYAVCGFVYAALLVINRTTGGLLFGAVPLSGWSALMVVLLISSGTVMLILGVFGEYLWRALEEVRGRPRFLIEDTINVADAGDRRRE